MEKGEESGITHGRMDYFKDFHLVNALKKGDLA